VHGDVLFSQLLRQQWVLLPLLTYTRRCQKWKGKNIFFFAPLREMLLPTMILCDRPYQ